MKRKFSTKILAALLAVMMLLTSAPLTALATFNDDDKATVVANAEAKMQEFENMFDANGTSYSNVSPAYTAMVNLQKALDSYQYGTGTKASVDNAINNLNTAMSNMVVFDPNAMTGTATPTFSGTAANRMYDYAGTAYSNVLYAPQATMQSEDTTTENSGKTKFIVHRTWYASDAVLLYTGNTDAVRLPVMMSAVQAGTKDAYSYNKNNRRIWAGYPAKSDQSDHDDWALVGQWHSGEGSNNADFAWCWWAGQWPDSGTKSIHAGYNYATGKPDSLKSGDGSPTSDTIPRTTRSGILGNYKYSESTARFMSNALVLKTAPTGPSANYSLNWCISTGADNNNDATNAAATTQIHVVNYEYLTDAVSKTASGLRSTTLADFSEGGLQNYFSVMDEAKAWNPNTYFNNNTTNGYSTCVADLTNLVDTRIAALPNENTADQYKDSSDYDALRKAMDRRAADYNKGVNTVYTNFDGFAELYRLAMAEMDNVVSNGYKNGTTVKSLADQIENYKLESHIEFVDASQLEMLIDAYNQFQKSLFVSTDACQAVIDNAIAEVWHGELYKKTDALSPADADGVEQDKVDAQVALVAEAIKALRINYTATTLTSEGNWNLSDAIALNANPDNLKDGRPSTDYANYSQFESAVNDGIAHKAVLESQDLISGNPETAYADYEAKVAAYREKIATIVYRYDHLSLSFFIINDGAAAKSAADIYYEIDQNKISDNINRNFYISLRVPGQDNVLIRRGHDAKSVVVGQAQIQYGVAVDGDKRGNYLDSFTLNADDLAFKREICADSGDDLPATSNDIFNYPPQMSISEGFGINNLVVSGYNQYYDAISNSKYGFYAYDEDGTQITDPQPAGDKYTQILSTTTGQSLKGGIFSHSNTSDHAGVVALSGDLYYNAPATTAKADPTVYKNKAELLSAYQGTNVIPQANPVTASHTFGGVYSWAANGGAFGTTAYAGYGFAKSDVAYNIGVTIIEAGDYFDFVALCELIVKNDSDRYTAQTMKAFTDAIASAKSYEYVGKDASIIIGDLNTKYYILRTALNNLVEKTFVVTFITKNAQGKDVTTKINLAYNDTVANHAAEFEKIDLSATYQADNKTWSFSHFTPAFDENAIVRDNITFTAVYEGLTNYIDFGRTDNAITTEYADYINSLIHVASYTYTVDTLKAVADTVAGLKFAAMPNDLTATEENLAAVNAEIASMKAFLDSLSPANVDPAYKDNAVAAEKIRNEAIKAHKADPDQYGVIPEFPVYEEVAITANVTAIGWKYTDTAAIDAAIAEFLSSLKLNDYKIYLNGSAVATLPYGTAVIVNSDGTVRQDVNNTDDSDASCSVVNWKYSFAAPSTNNTATPSKYYITAPSVGFKVQGDTYLTTENTQGAENTYVVKVVATTGNVIDVAVTTGSYTLPTAPNYAFYSFNGYTMNGSPVSGTISVDKNVTIVANYTAEAEATYEIASFDTYDGWLEDSGVKIEQYAYNELVDLENADAYCWVKAQFDGDFSHYTVLYYGSHYAFYACENVLYGDDHDGFAIVPLPKDEFEKLILGQSTIYKEFDSSLGRYVAHTEYVQDTDHIYAPDGTPILAETVEPSVAVFALQLPQLAPQTTCLDSQKMVKDAVGNKLRFTIIGTFVISEGYEIVENGFLFAPKTMNPSAMTLENAGNGYFRYKAPRYTSGDQFTSDITYAAGFDFTYVAYSIVKAPDGTLITCYSPTGCQGNTSNI